MQTDKITFRSTNQIKPLLEEISTLILNRMQANSNISALLLLTIGLLNKTYELTETAMWSIDNNRPQSSAFMLRGLYETLAFTLYVESKLANNDPEIIQNLIFGSKKAESEFKAVNILTCIEKATKKFEKLKKNYEELSEYVHPNAASHFYIAEATDKKQRIATLTIPFYKFKNTDKIASINQVGECCFHIIDISKRLIAKS